MYPSTLAKGMHQSVLIVQDCQILRSSAEFEAPAEVVHYHANVLDCIGVRFGSIPKDGKKATSLGRQVREEPAKAILSVAEFYKLLIPYSNNSLVGQLRDSRTTGQDKVPFVDTTGTRGFAEG